MRVFNVVFWLAALIVLLAVLATGVGLLWQEGGEPFSIVTVRGETVQLWGQGWYRYDTPIAALGFAASDVVTLFLAVPLLVVSALFYRRGSRRGGVLLSGVLAYFLYCYSSMAFGAAYNNLFLVYVVLMSASMFALILTLTSFDVGALPSYFKPQLPWRGIGVFLIASGVILALVWLGLSTLPALVRNRVPAEAHYYTTFVTGVIDLSFVAPALIIAGSLLLRRAPVGLLVGATLLVFTSVLGVNLLAGGLLQLARGAVSVGQAIGFTVPFVILAAAAVWLSIVLFRNFSETPLLELKAKRAGSPDHGYEMI